jgi:pseudaminic acid synthase
VSTVTIGDRAIGPGEPTYVVAEMSANHNQNFDQAAKIIEAAKAAGADAIKLQTYRADTMAVSSDDARFRPVGTAWADRDLYELYQEAHTPWEWHAELQQRAHALGLHFFSTPFDESAVDFLDRLGVPMHKIASFEIVDLPLLRTVAQSGKLIIMSTGMATLAEIDEAVATIRQAGGADLVLLKCTSAYPALPQDMNLLTIPDLAERFGVMVGLSDHTMDITVPVAAVALGARVIEKHLTLSRATGGPDSAFSLEPHEFRAMVEAVRETEKALGEVRYGAVEAETASRNLRRSLFVTENMRAGDVFSEKNIRSLRPGLGLHTRHLQAIVGKRAACDICRGTPVSWELLEGSPQ